MKQETHMRRSPTIILRAVLWLIGLLVLGFCAIALPAGLASDNTGYYKPILIGLYLPAVPFFIALHQAMKLLGYVDKNKAFTQASVEALKNIKLCAFVYCALFAAGQPYVFYAADRDDAPGVALIGFILIGVSFVIGTAAALFQRLFQNAVDIKAEHDLTV
jgi:hypothetical protein